MASQDTGKPAKPTVDEREDRLKAALKANMAKRKAQAKARQAQTTGGRGQNNNERGER